LVAKWTQAGNRPPKASHRRETKNHPDQDLGRAHHENLSQCLFSRVVEHCESAIDQPTEKQRQSQADLETSAQRVLVSFLNGVARPVVELILAIQTYIPY
jgi:hypothetical protein